MREKIAIGVIVAIIVINALNVFADLSSVIYQHYFLPSHLIFCDATTGSMHISVKGTYHIGSSITGLNCYEP